MCGFAGRVNVSAPVDRAQLEAMSALIAHRGPDGDGVYLSDRVGLAHRRLAIVDRAGGAQPAMTEDGGVVLVYNGEVYNHGELRAELAARGHKFVSRCDTEAILHAHEEYGVAAADRLRGMFAYAAWEEGPRRLTLVRDRLGVKPLYYATLPSGDLLFASELKALLVEPEVDRRLDEDALGAYLELRYVPGPATLLRSVRKLEPGAALVWSNGKHTTRRWWTVPVSEAIASTTRAEAGGRLCELLDEVVTLRRMGEVPIGAFLSGGLDSTIVAALLAQKARADGSPAVRTFSVGYRGVGTAASDELTWARLAAAHMGSEHRELIVSGTDVASQVARIAWHLDEPVGDPAAVPLWFLARRAREEVTVILSGEGADEVFAGYAAHRRAVAVDRVAGLPGAGTLARAIAGAVPAGRAARALRHVGAGSLAGHLGISRAFDPEARPFGSPGAAFRLTCTARQHAARARSTLARILAFDQQVWLPDDLLVKADKTTMAHALELRVPLLDHVLLEEVSAWPDSWKLSGGTGKAILRTAAAGLVPDAVLSRRKMGFATPAGAWLRGDLAQLLRDAILGRESLAAQRGASARIERLCLEHERGRDRTPELWALLALELWRQAVVASITTVPATGQTTWTSSALPTTGAATLSRSST